MTATSIVFPEPVRHLQFTSFTHDHWDEILVEMGDWLKYRHRVVHAVEHTTASDGRPRVVVWYSESMDEGDGG